MPKALELTGRRFGKLRVISKCEDRIDGYVMWNIQCDCGTHKKMRSSNITRGNHDTKSCGCMRGENLKTHGLGFPEGYNSWSGMIQRCNDPKSHIYKDYGARGITVCDRWLSYENFFEDMGVRPFNTSIERVDNFLGYNPGNCIWATKTEQGRNKRNNVFVEYKGETMVLSEACELSGVKYGTAHSRIQRGQEPFLKRRS